MHVKTRAYQSGDVDTMKKNHRRSGKKKTNLIPATTIIFNLNFVELKIWVKILPN